MENTIFKRILAMLGLVVFLAVLTLIPVYLYADSLYRELLDARSPQEIAKETAVTAFDLFAEENEHQTRSRIAGWLSAVSSQEIAVKSARGTLQATLYESLFDDPSAPWAIIFHGGLGTDRTQVLDVACELSLAGYRVLTPDLHAHGKSEGDASTLGFGDAQDVCAWIDYAEKAQMGARIVLFGVDEGATAVLTAACDGLSESVAAIAADSACNDGVFRLKEMVSGKTNRVGASLLRLMFERRTKQNGAKISERIAGTKTPILLIHGTGDQAIPAWQSEDIAHAAGENAQLLLIEGAGHGLSRFVAPEAYYEALLRFFENAL